MYLWKSPLKTKKVCLNISPESKQTTALSPPIQIDSSKK